MQTAEKDPTTAFRWDDPPDPDKYSVCVHCGLCLEACPTYQELGIENQSPRGRVYLIRAASEGRLPLDEALIDPVFRCLDCRACESVCPSGVRVGTLIEQARGQVFAARPARGFSGWLQRLFLRRIFPSPKRLRTLARLGRFYQRSGLAGLARATGVLRLLPAHLREMEHALPEIPARSSREVLPARMPARGCRKGQVALVTGCIMDVMFAETNVATARVLARNGFDVVVPEGQVCCGALQVHSGDRQTAKAMARRNIDVFLAQDVDAVIINAAGCGAALKEYGEWLRTDAAYRAKAEQFSRKVKDISEFLAEADVEPPKGRVDMTVTYHDACHLCHAQGIRRQPRELLTSVPGLRLVEMPDSERCCGSAGVYNLTHPEMAGPLLDRKMADVPDEAQAIVMGNPGCMMQIRVGVYRVGSTCEVMHTVDILDAAYRAEEGNRCSRRGKSWWRN
ncbi:MAG: heterodisulfide reductase-related iron-sulfur binding cluster [Kyrpidia sp.]|nr:heterodisulfide reductase-related iron-sulfur binding cluster [Kyrpidia sp.]